MDIIAKMRNLRSKFLLCSPMLYYIFPTKYLILTQTKGDLRFCKIQEEARNFIGDFFIGYTSVITYEDHLY